MKRQMTKEEAAVFTRRWDLVNAAEQEELRSTTAAVKFRQLAALMASVDELGWTESLREEEAEVRERWIKLRKAYIV